MLPEAHAVRSPYVLSRSGDWRTGCNAFRAMQALPYVIVLAGGEGQRLAPLTRALYGTDLPKQFAVLSGEQSLMQTTIERAAALTTPDRISVVVTAHHEKIARAQLAPYPGVELVVQPRNLDTGPGLLLPLVRILARAGSARVVFLPSDHHVSNPAPIAEALRHSGVDGLNDRISLLGVTPTGPEVEYGWIVRGARIASTGGFTVRRFLEKPTHAVADDLWRSGGLWNTFISSGPVRLFWNLAQRHLPAHTERLERYAAAIDGGDEVEALHAAYDGMAPANFSRSVLSNADELAVLPVAGSGWCDWGSPQRVFASLAGTACHARLVARIRGDMAAAGAVS
jgi:mannose-1-phosphate guanylyltransferase